MTKYEPGDKFIIEIEEDFGDGNYSIDLNENSFLTLSEHQLDALKSITRDSFDYDIGYADGVAAENERIRNVLFPFEED